VIKVLNFRIAGQWELELEFSDHTHGIFDAATYLANHQGPLLEALQDPDYFARVFVDAGALCWPNGLELSPARLQQLANCGVAA
jgi:Protein of unknown function (DUF2442)